MTHKPTAQIAAEVRERVRDRAALATDAQPLAALTITRLRECLPDVDPATVAAVLLHTVTIVGTLVLDEMNVADHRADRFDLLGLNVIAVAGEQLHTETTKPTADRPAPNRERTQP